MKSKTDCNSYTCEKQCINQSISCKTCFNASYCDECWDHQNEITEYKAKTCVNIEHNEYITTEFLTWLLILLFVPLYCIFIGLFKTTLKKCKKKKRD